MPVFGLFSAKNTCRSDLALGDQGAFADRRVSNWRLGAFGLTLSLGRLCRERKRGRGWCDFHPLDYGPQCVLEVGALVLANTGVVNVDVEPSVNPRSRLPTRRRCFSEGVFLADA